MYPRFASVNRPNLGAPQVRSSHGLEVGSALGELRLSAVQIELGASLGLHSTIDIRNTINECE